VPSGKSVIFKGYLKEFSDNFKSTWTPQKVYGRMDPILTFENTQRDMSLGWDIIAADLAESISNLAKLEVLMSMLYPFYNEGEQNTIQSAPLIKVRFANLIMEPPKTKNYSKDQAIAVENAKPDESPEEHLRRIQSGMSSSEGLIAAIDGFSYKPDMEAGFFVGNGTVFPKIIPMSCNMTIMHTAPVGWRKSSNPGEFSAGLPPSKTAKNAKWRGSGKWPYGVGGLMQKTPGVPNSKNDAILPAAKDALFAAITGRAGETTQYDPDRDVTEEPYWSE
jgi:hypothetical protein